MKSEMGSMYENKVWTFVNLPDDRQAIENKWIVKKKTDADGNVTVYKARLVMKGFRQVQGVDATSFSTALVFPEEEGMMQQSSVSISLSF